MDDRRRAMMNQMYNYTGSAPASEADASDKILFLLFPLPSSVISG